MQDYDVIILGGGAAGLMRALTAGQRGRRVLVLERTNKVGKKILMSGGGRCNFAGASFAGTPIRLHLNGCDMRRKEFNELCRQWKLGSATHIAHYAQGYAALDMTGCLGNRCPVTLFDFPATRIT